MRIKLIINPFSGGKKAKKYLPKIKEILSKNNILDVSETNDIIQIEKIAFQTASQKNHDILVVGGGDGTLNLAIKAIKTASPSPKQSNALPLGFIPLGITNVFALETGIPQNPLAACEIILKAKTKELDIGKISMPGKTCYFISMAGIGFDAEVTQRVHPKLKHILGAKAFVLQGLYDFIKYNPTPFYIQQDNGIPEKCFMAIVCNAKHYGGKFTFFPQASISDGILDICLLKNKHRRALLSFFFNLITKKSSPKGKNILSFQAKKFKIYHSGEKPVPVQIDGDVSGNLPAEFEVYPKALKMILP